METQITNAIILCTRLKIGRDIEETLIELRDLFENFSGFEVKGNAFLEIVINRELNALAPDVLIIPAASKNITNGITKASMVQAIQYGYYMEIRQSAIDSLTPEELVAVMMHELLHTVFTDQAIVRVLKAFNTARDKYSIPHSDSVLSPTNLYNDDVSDHSVDVVLYMILLDVCARTYKCDPMTSDIGADGVLVQFGLGEYYRQYLAGLIQRPGAGFSGAAHMTNDAFIEKEQAADIRSANTMARAILNNEVTVYYNAFRTSTYSVVIKNILRAELDETMPATIENITLKRSGEYVFSMQPNVIQEASTGTAELKLQYELDCILADIRHMSNESERQVVLHRIKNLSIKLAKKRHKLNSSSQHNSVQTQEQIAYIDQQLGLLNTLREECINANISPTQFGLFVKYPAGYEG